MFSPVPLVMGNKNQAHTNVYLNEFSLRQAWHSPDWTCSAPCWLPATTPLLVACCGTAHEVVRIAALHSSCLLTGARWRLTALPGLSCRQARRKGCREELIQGGAKKEGEAGWAVLPCNHSCLPVQRGGRGERTLLCPFCHHTLHVGGMQLSVGIMKGRWLMVLLCCYWALHLTGRVCTFLLCQWH